VPTSCQSRREALNYPSPWSHKRAAARAGRKSVGTSTGNAVGRGHDSCRRPPRGRHGEGGPDRGSETGPKDGRTRRGRAAARPPVRLDAIDRERSDTGFVACDRRLTLWLHATSFTLRSDRFLGHCAR
jgi:hypothetical protein